MSSEVLERLEAGSAAKDVKRMKCPFTGEEYLLLRALSPDVSFVHVQISDPEGNSQIHGARWENEEQAKAGKRDVVITEELVPTNDTHRVHPAGPATDDHPGSPRRSRHTPAVWRLSGRRFPML